MKQAPVNQLLMDQSALKFHEVGAEYLKMVPFYTSGKPALWIYLNIFGVAECIKKRFTSNGKCQKLQLFCYSYKTLSMQGNPYIILRFGDAQSGQDKQIKF